MRTSVDVHNALVERGITHELVPLRGRFRKPDRIASALGLSPSQVARVVLYEGDGRVVAAVVASDREPDPERVAKTAKIPVVRPLTAGKASDVTGFLHDALPPVGLPSDVKVLIDRPLTREEVLYFSGGEVSSVLKIRPADLRKATHGSVATISR